MAGCPGTDFLVGVQWVPHQRLLRHGEFTTAFEADPLDAHRVELTLIDVVQASEAWSRPLDGLPVGAPVVSGGLGHTITPVGRAMGRSLRGIGWWPGRGVALRWCTDTLHGRAGYIPPGRVTASSPNTVAAGRSRPPPLPSAFCVGPSVAGEFGTQSAARAPVMKDARAMSGDCPSMSISTWVRRSLRCVTTCRTAPSSSRSRTREAAMCEIENVLFEDRPRTAETSVYHPRHEDRIRFSDRRRA